MKNNIKNICLVLFFLLLSGSVHAIRDSGNDTIPSTVPNLTVSGTLSSVTVNVSGITNTEALAVTTAAVSGTLNVAEVTLGSATRNMYSYAIWDKSLTVAQLRSMASDLSAAGGGTLEFAYGTWTFTTSFNMYENVDIKGVGQGTKFYFPNDTYGFAMENNCFISDCDIEGAGDDGSSTKAAIVFNGVDLADDIFMTDRTGVTNVRMSEWGVGIHMRITGNSQWISGIDCSHFHTNDVKLPIWLQRTNGFTGSFINGNRFSDFNLNDYDDTAVLIQDADQNQFDMFDIQEQGSASFGFDISGAYGNSGRGNVWDLTYGSGERMIRLRDGSNRNTFHLFGQDDPRLVQDEGWSNRIIMNQASSFATPAQSGMTILPGPSAFQGRADNFMSYGIYSSIMADAGSDPVPDYQYGLYHERLFDNNPDTYLEWDGANTVNITITFNSTVNDCRTFWMYLPSPGDAPATVNLWVLESGTWYNECSVGGMVSTNTGFREIHFDVRDKEDATAVRFELVGNTGTNTRRIAELGGFSSREMGRTFIGAHKGEIAGEVLFVKPTQVYRYTGLFVLGEFANGDVAKDDVIFMDTDGKWYDADADTTTENVMLGLAIDASGAGADRLIMTKGFLRDPDYNFTPGLAVYVSATAGQLTQTEPSTTGQASWIVGNGWDESNVLWFEPEKRPTIIP